MDELELSFVYFSTRCKFTPILNCLVCLLHMYFPYFHIWENSYETTFQILWKPMHLLWFICKLRSTQQSERIWGEMWEEKMQFLLSSLTLKGSKKASQSLSLPPGVYIFSGSKLWRLFHYLFMNPKFLLFAMKINLVCIGPEEKIR